ncbi:protoporphyrinogen oxidase HemJ [Swingsia samuiensis]|uniref:Protoporphyrinogen IX oxidase n=1 Tax=Swingsia samuiensis TaxID=1293412 RepID=A0A4Y6UH34_9PROT|nr:protoporphyrinogen oxidase HemJ [Swingsia samuiensis]QDH16889.1 protoporphyrinogen oxidase HemJ [Swingsia samuiensis]
MINFFAIHLSWLLALHIMAFTAWMAGMFYLPRLYVYHTQVIAGTAEDERFKVMERKLLKQIMTPAMIVTVMVGVIMASIPDVIDWYSMWWWVKLICVFGLVSFHGACSKWRKLFYKNENNHSEKFYRMMNEVPTVLMIILVIMIVVRP